MINFVYFDVGGVVVKDFSGTNKWEDLRSEIGVTSDKKDGFDKIWGAHKDTHSTIFDVDNLIPALKNELCLEIPREYSLLMGFVNRFERNEQIWPAISEMKKNVPVGLLTNMYPRMLGKIIEAGLFPAIDWDIIVDSSIVRMKKPDIEIYRYAQEKTGVTGNEILFVENSMSHLKPAQECDWQTFYFDTANIEESCVKLLDYFRSNR
ncbi:MAG: hypothetical protein ACD_50C00389G0003 [uncultured bacterium]|nr:MAG: hypothetical protein ACD_50C00389G0003 [uncultured bacterium]